MHSALVWLARQLQVDAPEHVSAWLKRLFLPPKPAQAPVVIDPARVPDPGAWLAMQLDIAPGSPWRLWLWRLLVLPARGQQKPKAVLKELAQACWRPVWQALPWFSRFLRALWLISLWPVRFMIGQLNRVATLIDSQRVVREADKWFMPLLVTPGLRWLILASVCIVSVIVMTTPLNRAGQLLFILLCWACSMVLRKLPGRFPSLALAMISLITMGRYGWWRLTTTLDFDSYPETALGLGLLAAEAYTWLVVVLGFIQTAWPLNRQAAILNDDQSTWPTIDVFIPTYNEPLTVVRPTTLAAIALDWPKDKLRIFILDDGRRDEFREFARAMGVGYIIRDNNRHAKAGNLNHALEETHGELIAIFDCDHLPVSSFLKTTVGWLQRDPQCAMVQTPHHFFSPDPFERNLGTFRRVPNEGALFYGLIQDGNDFWDATFFCGSCAVIRREPLMSIGGIAVETVTEDAHTALKLQRLGYSTAYINQTLAAGLATESLSAHIGQRIRWARGMAQIIRIDNPFLGVGLSLWQRICYANAMLHFFFGLPRLVFLTAPMAFLFFQWHIINAEAVLLALYVIPNILQSNIANTHVQGSYRHSFWAEVYETVLAWYVALPTTVALIKPSAGTFNVTAKGGLVTKSYFDWAISTPYTILALLNIAAFGMGLLRLFFWNTHEIGTVLLNLAWVIYNTLLLGASIGVASESRQVRRMHRVATRLPATLYRDNGAALHCECVDFSMTGLGLQMTGAPLLSGSEQVHVSLWRDGLEHAFPARVVLNKAEMISVQFDVLTREQEIALVQCTFARPDAWTDWNESHDTDRPLQGLQEITMVGLQGYKKLWSSIVDPLKDKIRERRTLSQSTTP